MLKIVNWFQNRRSKDDSSVDRKNKKNSKKEQKQQQQQHSTSWLCWPNFLLDDVSSVSVFELATGKNI